MELEWLTSVKEQWNNRSRDLEDDSVDNLTRQTLQTKKVTIHYKLSLFRTKQVCCKDSTVNSFGGTNVDFSSS